MKGNKDIYIKDIIRENTENGYLESPRGASTVMEDSGVVRIISDLPRDGGDEKTRSPTSIASPRIKVKGTDVRQLTGKPHLQYGKKKTDSKTIVRTLVEFKAKTIHSALSYMPPANTKRRYVVLALLGLVLALSPYAVFQFCTRFHFGYWISLLFYLATSTLTYILGTIILVTFLPRIIGWLLTNILYYTAMNRYPLVFEAVHVQPWMNDWSTLHLRVAAENVKFGNPPKQFADSIPWFLVCEWFSFRMSITMENLFGLALFGACEWSPFPSFFSEHRKPGKITSKPRYCSCVDFKAFDFKGVTINFAEKEGLFNINGFTSALAKGECRRSVERVFGRGKWPNSFVIRVIRCRGLKVNSDLKPNVRVHVKLRSQQGHSRLHIRNEHPVIDESFELRAHDPSTVVHVQVVDEGMGQKVIGNWVFTLKWFYLSPFFSHHNTMSVDKNYRDAEGQRAGWVIKGWFPLLDDYFDTGDCGEIELWMNWTYKEKNKNWLPPRLTALQQMTENSAETNLRLGHVPNILTMLQRFPVMLNVDRITIRDIKFYLKDLFTGEVKDAASREAIKIKCMDLSGFSPEEGEQGITLLHFLKTFAIGIGFQVNSGVIGQGVHQVLGGLFAGFTSLFASSKTEVKSHDKGRMNMEKIFAGNERHGLLTAFDHDYWKPADVEGFLEFLDGEWTMQRAEIRGCCLFFYPVNEHFEKIGVVEKVDLALVTQTKWIRRNFGELEIQLARGAVKFKFRVPKDVARPTLEDWHHAVQTFCVRKLDVIHFELINARRLPSMDMDGGTDPFVDVSIENKFGNECAYKSRSTTKHSLNPDWNESYFLWPIDDAAARIKVEVWDDDVLNKDDPLGFVIVPIESVTGEHTEYTMNLMSYEESERKDIGNITFKVSKIKDAEISEDTVKCAGEFKGKMDRMEQLVDANSVVRSLDSDLSGDLSTRELRPLLDIPDDQLQKSLNKFFGAEGLNADIDAKTLKYIDGATLRSLLGERAEKVHKFLLDKQKKAEEKAAAEAGESETAEKEKADEVVHIVAEEDEH
uniref:C2 domain-containing protein n=1 Tax=Lotharella globosa TaxID=91324 RepID=A0A6V3IJT5_9EUKA